MRLVFFLEELSMKRFLDEFLPRYSPALQFLCIPHEGKSDLEKSLPRKLRAWNSPEDQFIVLRDSDGARPGDIEARLLQLCVDAGKPATPIRVAYQELEAWYLGDFAGLESAYGVDLSSQKNKSMFRNPDTLGSPSSLVKKLVPEFQKVDGARRIGKVINNVGNKSISFRDFCGALG